MSRTAVVLKGGRLPSGTLVHSRFLANGDLYVEYEPTDLDDLEDVLASGLRVHGEHHKQWYLEEAAGILGFDVGRLRDCAEPGIAP